MSNRERVEELIETVLEGRILDAIDAFYGDDVRMQENNHPPTVGKEANRQREEAFVAGIAQVRESRALSYVVDGDRAAIHWLLDFTSTDGARFRFDQIAYQTWRDGKIVEERFFYDSVGLVQETGHASQTAANS